MAHFIPGLVWADVLAWRAEYQAWHRAATFRLVT